MDFALSNVGYAGPVLSEVPWPDGVKPPIRLRLYPVFIPAPFTRACVADIWEAEFQFASKAELGVSEFARARSLTRAGAIQGLLRYYVDIWERKLSRDRELELLLLLSRRIRGLALEGFEHDQTEYR